MVILKPDKEKGLNSDLQCATGALALNNQTVGQGRFLFLEAQLIHEAALGTQPELPVSQLLVEERMQACASLLPTPKRDAPPPVPSDGTPPHPHARDSPELRPESEQAFRPTTDLRGTKDTGTCRTHQRATIRKSRLRHMGPPTGPPPQIMPMEVGEMVRD